jgi:predicted Fe-Mo cluster-binding NifX family protein
MKVAVSYQNGEIYEHFGHAECFAIYDFDMSDLNNTTKKLIDVSQLHGHEAMVERMKAEGVDAVLCGNMGGEGKALLLSYGIVPVVGYSGHADTAADMLVTGQLPITPGGEGGGCSCGGDCGGCGSGGGCSCGSSCGDGCNCGDMADGGCSCSCGC